MPDRVQADVLHARAAAGGHEQPVAAQLVAVRELEHVLVAVPARGGGVLAEAQLDAVGRQGLGRAPLPSGSGSRGSTWSAPSTSADLAAQPHHGLGHLDAHRAAAEDEQPPRDLLQAGDLAVRPHAVEVRQALDRRDERVGAGGDHDVLRGVGRAVDRDLSGTGDARRSPRITSMPLPSYQPTFPESS